MKYYLDAFKNYADINGTMDRKSYWMFNLINIVIFLIVQIAGNLIGFPMLGYIYLIVSLIPFGSATARRLKDVGKAKWWLVFTFIFPVGTLFIIYFLCKKSSKK